MGSRSRRRVIGAAFAVGLGVAALGGAPASALAADDCPNAAVRAQQQSQHLPNCMAYERVSPADKNGGAPIPEVKLSADGNGLLYFSPIDVDQSASSVYGRYRAERGSEGWLATSLNPAYTGAPPTGPDTFDMHFATDDLQRIVGRTAYGLAANDRGRHATAAGAPGSYDVYIREPDGSFTWVAPDDSGPDTTSPSPVVDPLGASPDLERVVVKTARPFDPRVTTTNVLHVFVWTRTGTHLATVLPNGDLPSAMPNDAQNVVRVSEDARRIAFVDSSTATPALYVRVNADDPASAQTREVAVGPNGEQCTGAGATLQGLSGDGTKVLFLCDSPLVAGAPANGLYMRDLDGGPGAVRLIGPGALGPVLKSNPDYSRIYVNGPGGLSLIRDGVPERIAPAGPTYSAVSADGEYFAFSTLADVGLSGVDTGPPGTEQTYRYSARTGEIVCISCQQDGSPTTGRGVLREEIPYVAIRQPMNSVADNGSVAFSSMAGLDPADTNGVFDAYAWIDGRQVLLSGGRDAEPSMSNGTAQGGAAFFFTSPDALVEDDRDGGGYDIYTARPGGGFLVPDAPSECTGSCRPAGPERPSLPGVGSIDGVGRGNLVEQVTSPAARATASITAPRSVRGKSATVRVKVSRAGAIRVSGAGVRAATVKAKKAGTYRVTVRLSAHGTKQQRKRGRFATKLTARFAPESGASVSARKSVTFTATTKGGR